MEITKQGCVMTKAILLSLVLGIFALTGCQPGNGSSNSSQSNTNDNHPAMTNNPPATTNQNHTPGGQP